MKEFVFNDCNICINPNKVDGQVKKFRWQITTALYNGKWTYGYSFDTPTGGWGCGVWKDRESYTSEHDAIEAGAKRGIEYFEGEQDRGMNIPKQIFQQLKDLCGTPKPVQLLLFDF